MKPTEAKTNVPPPNFATAIRLYYSTVEIGNKEISELFGITVTTRLYGLKRMARKQMAEDHVPTYNSHCVNTEAAFKAWGLDIAELEKKFAKLQKYGFAPKVEVPA